MPPAPVQVPRQWPLAPSIMLVMSANDKGDNEMILGAVHRSPGIYRRAEEILTFETIDEGCVTSHNLK